MAEYFEIVQLNKKIAFIQLNRPRIALTVIRVRSLARSLVGDVTIAVIMFHQQSGVWHYSKVYCVRQFCDGFVL